MEFRFTLGLLTLAILFCWLSTWKTVGWKDFVGLVGYSLLAGGCVKTRGVMDENMRGCIGKLETEPLGVTVDD